MKGNRHIILIVLVSMLAAVDTTSAEVTEVELVVDGLSCPFCVFNLEKPLTSVPSLTSLETNYQAGVVRASLKPNQPIDLAQLRQAIADTGFTLRTIRLTAVGTVSRWEGSFVLNARYTGQQFLLYPDTAAQSFLLQHLLGSQPLEQPLTAWRAAQTLVEVTGSVHEHPAGPPALTIETIEEVGR